MKKEKKLHQDQKLLKDYKIKMIFSIEQIEKLKIIIKDVNDKQLTIWEAII